MWVSDGWFADVPDTFALLPRDISDGFYSLDEYYEYRDSICLGGPNFDPKTTSPEALAKNGFDSSEIKKIIADLCLNKHAHDSVIVFEKDANITWTHAGTSETILKRKLKRIGVEYDSNKGRLGYTTFFTFMVRYPLNFICFYLEQGYFIPWAKEYHHTSAAVAPGCNLMMTSFNLLHESQYSSCDTNFKAIERPAISSSSSSSSSSSLAPLFSAVTSNRGKKLFSTPTSQLLHVNCFLDKQISGAFTFNSLHNSQTNKQANKQAKLKMFLIC
jgi:hypothetical protein